MDPIAPSDEAPKPVHYSQLISVPAMSAIGLTAAKLLHEHRIVTLMINRDGVLEVVPVGELELDQLNDIQALSKLADQGYTDTQMQDYLRQREDRVANKALVQG